jgi:hypothetical protein
VAERIEATTVQKRQEKNEEGLKSVPSMQGSVSSRRVLSDLDV